MSEEYQEVLLDKIRLGTVLNFPVLHRGTVLLLAEGTVVTPRVVDLLLQRGIDRVRMHVEDIARAVGEGADDEQYSQPIEPASRYYRTVDPPPPDRNLRNRAIHFKTVASRRIDDEIAERGELTRQPGASRVFVRTRSVSDAAELHLWFKERDEREQELAGRSDHWQQTFIQRGRVDAGPLLRLFEAMIHELGQNPDLFCFQRRPPAYAPYPATHSFNVARLSMAVAGYLGWSRDEILAVGVGAFCHDVGMLRLPVKLFRTRSRIDSIQRNDLVKHPMFSLDLVDGNYDMHEYVRFIVYQTHERANGCGYPRARTTATTHPAARLVGLVDAFIAMSSYRPHRNPLLPHHAMLEIMQETHAGFWDPAMVRGLMRAVSLYPLGSFVELSDGRLVRSVQVCETDQKKPLLEVWDDPAAVVHEMGELLDLRMHPRLTIARAVPAPQIM